jgi:hypothetical protein
MAENERAAGFIPIVGIGAGVMVKVTEMVCGELVAPDATTVITPLCGPAVSPLGLTLTAMVPALLPEADAAPLIFNQGIFEDADQVSVPVPTLLIATDWLAGVTPFWTAENESTNGLSPIAGIAGVGVDGGGGVTDNDGGASTCVKPGICAAKLRMLRPPPLDPAPADAVAPPAAATGRLPCDDGEGGEGGLARGTDADVEAILVDARGAMKGRLPVFLFAEEASLDEVVMSG